MEGALHTGARRVLFERVERTFSETNALEPGACAARDLLVLAHASRIASLRRTRHDVCLAQDHSLVTKPMQLLCSVGQLLDFVRMGSACAGAGAAADLGRAPRLEVSSACARTQRLSAGADFATEIEISLAEMRDCRCCSRSTCSRLRSTKGFAPVRALSFARADDSVCVCAWRPRGSMRTSVNVDSERPMCKAEGSTRASTCAFLSRRAGVLGALVSWVRVCVRLLDGACACACVRACERACV
eukprot:6183424-Pleurochrysis_carterae.AAC.1